MLCQELAPEIDAFLNSDSRGNNVKSRVSAIASRYRQAGQDIIKKSGGLSGFAGRSSSGLGSGGGRSYGDRDSSSSFGDRRPAYSNNNGFSDRSSSYDDRPSNDWSRSERPVGRSSSSSSSSPSSWNSSPSSAGARSFSRASSFDGGAGRRFEANNNNNDDDDFDSDDYKPRSRSPASSSRGSSRSKHGSDYDDDDRNGWNVNSDKWEKY